jgi:integrase
MAISKRRGKWVADFRDATGKRHWISKDTRKEAEKAFAEARVAIHRDEYVAPNDRTLADAFNEWFRLCVEGCDNESGAPLKPTTRAFYSGLWRRYLAERAKDEPEKCLRLGAVKVRRIDVALVARWKQELSGAVGPRSVVAAFGLLGQLLTFARRFSWMHGNPLEHVHKPRHTATVRAIRPDELALLLAQADAETRLLLRVSASTGLRASELFGVRFEDIDMATGEISIARQLRDGLVSTLKTARSTRTVRVPQSVLRELREHPRRFAAGLVFTSPDGAPIHLSNFHKRTWRPLCEKAGIVMLDERGRKVTFHSLRHTAATAAIAAGENIPDVAAMLGHASPNVTLTIYADAWRAKAEHSAEALAGVLFGETGSKTVANTADGTGARAEPVSEMPISEGFGMVGRVGVEPTTKRLRVSCSTN